MAHEFAECLGVHFDVRSFNLAAINDGWDEPFFTEAADCCGTATLAGLGVEIKDGSHGRLGLRD